MLTDADLDHLADEAEAGYDLSTWVPRRGRPALGHRSARGHSPKIETRVPAGVRTELARIAAEDGTTVSQVLRHLVEDYVRERGARRRP